MDPVVSKKEVLLPRAYEVMWAGSKVYVRVDVACAGEMFTQVKAHEAAAIKLPRIRSALFMDAILYEENETKSIRIARQQRRALPLRPGEQRY